MKTKWTKKWPIEPGWYWFYGDAYSRARQERHTRLYTVRVIMGQNAPVHICEGHFIYESEADSKALWRPMTVPREPL